MNGLAEWWNHLAVGGQLIVIDLLVFIGAIFGSRVVYGLVKGYLERKKWDEYFRPPWAAKPQRRDTYSPAQTAPAKMPPSAIAGWLSVITVWLMAFWFVGTQHGLLEEAEKVRNAVAALWVVALGILLAILVAQKLAGALYELCTSDWVLEYVERKQKELGEGASSSNPRDFPEFLGMALGMMAYFFILTLTLVGLLEILRLTVMADAALSLWQLVLQIAMATVAVGLGFLGSLWIERQSSSARAAGVTDLRFGHQVGVGVFAAAVILAILLLPAGSNIYIGLLAVLIVGALLWALRSHLRDVWAGFLLKNQAVKQVVIDGESCLISFVGPLMTELAGKSGPLRRLNREVLAAALGQAAKDRAFAPGRAKNRANEGLSHPDFRPYRSTRAAEAEHIENTDAPHDRTHTGDDLPEA